MLRTPGARTPGAGEQHSLPAVQSEDLKYTRSKALLLLAQDLPFEEKAKSLAGGFANVWAVAATPLRLGEVL